MFKAYPHSISVRQGSSLSLHVWTEVTTPSSFYVHFFRQGTTLAYITSSSLLTVTMPASYPQRPRCYEDWDCPPFAFSIPSSWTSGVYIAILTASATPPSAPEADARDGMALFVVTPATPGSSSPILMKIPTFTYHAYNREGDGVRSSEYDEGGGSLYNDQYLVKGPDGEDTYRMRVTLLRPGGGTGGRNPDPIGEFRSPPTSYDDLYDHSSPRQVFAHWDARAIRWLESHGYTVEYCTDMDLHVDATLLPHYRLMLTFGHDEYWTAEMRNHLDSFVAQGGNVAIFAGNVCYRQTFITNGGQALEVRWGFAPSGSVERHDAWGAHGNWPEERTVGLSSAQGSPAYDWWVSPREPIGFTTQAFDHWLFQGTSLVNGTVFGAEERIVGYEADGTTVDTAQGYFTPAGPPNPTPQHYNILAVSPQLFLNSMPVYIALGFFRNRGTVFNTGTTDWPRVLEAGNISVGKITKNTIDELSRARFGSNPVAQFTDSPIVAMSSCIGDDGNTRLRVTTAQANGNVSEVFWQPSLARQPAFDLLLWSELRCRPFIVLRGLDGSLLQVGCCADGWPGQRALTGNRVNPEEQTRSRPLMRAQSSGSRLTRQQTPTTTSTSSPRPLQQRATRAKYTMYGSNLALPPARGFCGPRQIQVIGIRLWVLARSTPRLTTSTTSTPSTPLVTSAKSRGAQVSLQDTTLCLPRRLRSARPFRRIAMCQGGTTLQSAGAVRRSGSTTGFPWRMRTSSGETSDRLARRA